MIPIKQGEEIEAMRRSCRLTAQIRDELSAMVEPGVTTKDIDEKAKSLIQDAGARSAFLNYRGFPGNICISVNEEVVHGIGSARRKLLYGDVVKLDVGVILNGWVGDTATSVPVGMIQPEVEALLKKTQETLSIGIDKALPGRRLGDICSAIEKSVNGAGYSVVREFVGHGIGRRLHEEPQIPNYGKAGTGPKLKAGMIFAIEPMVNLGRAEVKILKDGWTVATRDGKPSAHFEHTVLLTEEGPEILTKI